MDKHELLAKTSKDLMLKEAFYGFFLMSINKTWSDQVPTAGVAKNGVNCQLYINEDFFMGLTPNKRIGLLKHELLHIAFFHLFNYESLANKQIANIAMDIEINQYIDPNYLPDGGVTIDNFPELNLEPKKGTRYYYDKLLQAAQNNSSPNLSTILTSIGEGKKECEITKQTGSENIKIPNHDTWKEFEEGNEAEQKLTKKNIENTIKEIVEQTVKSRGTVPGEISEIIKAFEELEPEKFNWRRYIRQFAGGATKVYTKKTYRKHNKRFDENPGLKIKKQRHMLVAIDTSGSVSTNELKEFLNEIHHITKTGTEVTILQCDTNVRDIKKFSPNQEFKIVGRGGTDFQPVINYYVESLHKYSALIFFTDGEAPAPVNARGKILWVLSSTSAFNEELPGYTIKLEV